MKHCRVECQSQVTHPGEAALHEDKRELRADRRETREDRRN
jgi:hypothetical protein